MPLPDKMPNQSVDAVQFLKLSGALFDVRSPGEYSQGHIPGAISLPLFTNEERALVGTTYKQQGRDQAVELGLRLAGARLADLVVCAKAHAKDGVAKVYCWRGGMRSMSVAWLLQTAGLQTFTLQKGYKSFRQWVFQTLAEPRSLKIVGGLSGCGKTAFLRTLREKGEQVLDLEKLACHRGSSFGGIGAAQQPTNENFENTIAMELSLSDPNAPLWIEDESRMIGRCKIPDPLFQQMQQQELLILETSQEERLHRLVEDYGNIPSDHLLAATERLRRKLGGARTEEIIQNIKGGHFYPAAKLILNYYDSAYQHSLRKRNQPRLKLEPDNSRL